MAGADTYADVDLGWVEDDFKEDQAQNAIEGALEAAVGAQQQGIPGKQAMHVQTGSARVRMPRPLTHPTDHDDDPMRQARISTGSWPWPTLTPPPPPPPPIRARGGAPPRRHPHTPSSRTSLRSFSAWPPPPRSRSPRPAGPATAARHARRPRPSARSGASRRTTSRSTSPAPSKLGTIHVFDDTGLLIMILDSLLLSQTSHSYSCANNGRKCVV